ncbi:hypothetical protein WICPIJ_000516 [Wickerhamomyces pijperi]|uniref:Uncharacterized protein n=1 Tax=Wickerhamomyces pijperi TaxID=599730 RepID=A0A9P8QGH7_WICPI|nr:hypothetical protein WICPIJ_000516 [Wickerhamomyces pijperi]
MSINFVGITVAVTVINTDNFFDFLRDTNDLVVIGGAPALDVLELVNILRHGVKPNASDFSDVSFHSETDALLGSMVDSESVQDDGVGTEQSVDDREGGDGSGATETAMCWLVVEHLE